MGIRIRSLPAALSKRTAGVAAAAGALVVAGVPGATAASAAAARPDSTTTYHCTAGLPEICVGLNHTGDYVWSEDAQVQIGYYSSEVHYYFSDIHGTVEGFNAYPSHGGPGWVSGNNWDWGTSYSPGDNFCATASMPHHGQLAYACVKLP